MITADLANGYSKEVFAFPGRTTDVKSAGCHWLIRNHQANLISGAQDLIQGMGWEKKQAAAVKKQQELFVELNASEQTILNILKERESMHIDAMNAVTGFTQTLNAATLLSLEMKDLIQSLPGRIYTLKH
jgi:DNA processing protein